MFQSDKSGMYAHLGFADNAKRVEALLMFY